MPRLLGQTEKTGISFGLAAGPISDGGTCPMAHRSAICKKCYARCGGNYAFKCVQNAHTRRLAVSASDLFVDMMTNELTAEAMRSQKRSEPCLFFRGHDSGDFYSIEYVRKWISIVSNVRRMLKEEPVSVRYWFPTRVWPIDAFLPALQDLNAEPGVAVHPSSLGFNLAPPVVKGLSAGCSVGIGYGDCVAVENGHKNRLDGGTRPTSCKGCACRRCWSKRGKAIFRYHA